MPPVEPWNGPTWGPPAAESTRDLLRDLTDDVKALVRMEIALAKTELGTYVADVRRSAVWFGIAAGLAAFGAFTLPWAAIYALGLVLPLWAAVLIVAGVALLGAAGAAVIGKRKLDAMSAHPSQTLKSLEETRRWLAEPMN